MPGIDGRHEIPAVFDGVNAAHKAAFLSNSSRSSAAKKAARVVRCLENWMDREVRVMGLYKIKGDKVYGTDGHYVRTIIGDRRCTAHPKRQRRLIVLSRQPCGFRVGKPCRFGTLG